MRYVVDFDNTIAMHVERDWENATPNTPLIEILNKLYDEGHDVSIFTARGTLSCNGDRELAERTYRGQIETWLNKHGVKYTMLSFNKPLADVYVDDKAMTPWDFVEAFKGN